MKRVLAVIVLCLAATTALGVDMGSIIKAQVVLGQVTQVVDKYKEVQALLDAGTVELEVPEPIQDNSGKFLLPFDEAGNPTAWADKALNAQAGAAVGGVVGDKAVGALASKVPFGGLLAGAAKGKVKETGAVVAIGGWDFIKENSTLSFDSLDDYSVYMHTQFNGLPGYEAALASAMAIYPKLEKSHKGSVDKAYKDAQKRAKKLAK
jgi:hypothetical protein